MWDFIKKCEILFRSVRFYSEVWDFIIFRSEWCRASSGTQVWYNVWSTYYPAALHTPWRLVKRTDVKCEILFKNVRFYSYFRRFWVAKYTIGDQKLVPCAHKYIFGALACVLDGKTKFHFFHVRFYSYSWSKFTYVRF